MSAVKRQIRKLYALSVLGNLSLTGAWVAILAARGFSLVEIGFAETCYHIASLMTEIPSGTLADVYGRKRMLMISTFIHIAASAVMILSTGLPLVCFSIALHAVCDSFASGSGDALAFDSMKSAGQENRYDRYESNQLIIYRLCGGVSTLCAGFALVIGYRIAYATGIATSMIQLVILGSLKEIRPEKTNLSTVAPSAMAALAGCFRDSLQFLRRETKAFLLMMTNSLIGAVDILLLFFLQAIPDADRRNPRCKDHIEVQETKLQGYFYSGCNSCACGDSARTYRHLFMDDCRRIYCSYGGRCTAGTDQCEIAGYVSFRSARHVNLH